MVTEVSHILLAHAGDRACPVSFAGTFDTSRHDFLVSTRSSRARVYLFTYYTIGPYSDQRVAPSIAIDYHYYMYCL